ncbi:FIG033376: Heat shock protein DnaJ-like [hydrothermal vent metagenome]|uniref:FIG033376: Heat shock protein DnaJ-like n=1 Tax=hydrothermal vent metagenome TaxID=652676 RepID=A0A3B0TA54_9ZZZZ
MQWFFLAIVVLSMLILVSGPLVNVNPKVLARALRVTGGLLALGAAALLFYVGRTGFAIPLAALGVMLLGRGLGGRGFRYSAGNARKSAGQTSTVRTGWLEMQLDHDTGEMSGRFTRGLLAGRSFADLSRAEIVEAHGELLALDGQSAQLLEAYLDRHFEGWHEGRGARGASAGARAGGGAGGGGSGPMSMAEAYEILGLEPGASDAQISAAHRRLMKNLHPDQGGSTFLAAKVNQAKDVAMGHKR